MRVQRIHPTTYRGGGFLAHDVLKNWLGLPENIGQEGKKIKEGLTEGFLENTLFRLLQEKKEQDEDSLLIILGLVNLMGLIDIINGRAEKIQEEKIPDKGAKNSSTEALMGLLSQMAHNSAKAKPNRQNRFGEKNK